MKKTLIITACIMAWLFLGLYTIAHAAPQAGAEWTHDGVNTTQYALKYVEGTDITVPGNTLTFPANQRTAIIENLKWSQQYTFSMTADGPGGATTFPSVTIITPDEPVEPPNQGTLRIQITVTEVDGSIRSWTLASAVED